MDGLLNFSRSFLPQNRGGTMDAPLVLTSRIDPSEIDKEALNVDVCDHYPIEVYTSALVYAEPKTIVKLIDRVENRIGTTRSVEGFQFTHDTSDISSGPLESMYTQMKTMTDKLEAELVLAEKIRAVDADDVAERVLTTHFLRDLMGNLSAFSKQKFRCTKCNTSYRRMPLSMYTQMKTMTDKLEAELVLAEKIRAVDADDVAERVLTTHFLRDLMGNLSAFSKQKFRCTKCNTSYRRMPLAGKCTKFKGKGICNGNIIPTVHEGSVKKYLEMSREMCRKYKISEYTKQRMEVLDLAITSTFGEEKHEQLGLADFM